MINFKQIDKNSIEAIVSPNVIMEYINNKQLISNITKLTTNEFNENFDVHRFFDEQVMSNEELAEFFIRGRLLVPSFISFTEREDRNLNLRIEFLDEEELKNAYENIKDIFDDHAEYDDDIYLSEPNFKTDFFTRDNELLRNIDKAFKYTHCFLFESFNYVTGFLKKLSHFNIAVTVAKKSESQYIVLLVPKRGHNKNNLEEVFSYISSYAVEYMNAYSIPIRQGFFLIVDAIEHDNIILLDQRISIFS